MEPLKASKVSMRTKNPIRNIVDKLNVKPNPGKEFISLALGDPTIFGNLKIDSACVDSVQQHLHSYKANGYPPSIGTLDARTSIAKEYSRPNNIITSNDVIIASGCSDALNLSIGVLCDEGQNILLPAPGFSLYETLASSKGIACKFYNLIPEDNWQIDLQHLDSLIDSNTKCILVNNPSNPCGSVYSKSHLLNILKIAEKHNLPLIADEIYADMVFEGFEFFSMAELSTNVPILTCGGLAKQYLVPGWRVGWVIINDRNDQFEHIRKGLVNLSQLTLGANSLIQAALPEILATPKTFLKGTMEQLENNALLSQKILGEIPGIVPIYPQGAMYLMVSSVDIVAIEIG